MLLMTALLVPAARKYLNISSAVLAHTVVDQKKMGGLWNVSLVAFPMPLFPPSNILKAREGKFSKHVFNIHTHKGA